MSVNTRRETYKLASVGLLLLLIQAVILLLLMIAVAYGIGSKNSDFLALFIVSMLFIAIPIALLGFIGRVLCLIAPSTSAGRILIALGLVMDVGATVGVTGFLDLPGKIAWLLPAVPMLLFIGYLISLAGKLPSAESRRSGIGSLACLIIGVAVIVVGFSLDLGGDPLINLAISGGGFCVCVYGYMLYLRTISTLRSAIASPEEGQEETEPVKTEPA